ncbi:MAG: DNA adenine methylase [Succinivibrio sp.]
MTTANSELAPLLKWAGGKRSLLKKLLSSLPKSFDNYCEPFLGGGSLLFALHPQKAIVSDINFELINLYKVVMKQPEKLIRLLCTYPNDKDFFYSMRSQDREDGFDKKTPLELAARTYYLNRTCFNGLYRLSKKGYFNSPYGYYKTPFGPNKERIRAVSAYLNTAGIDIDACSYETTCNKLQKGDFVYLDPPYDLVESHSFVAYNKEVFRQNDQVSLRDLCIDLDSRGVKFLLSNSATENIISLYKDFKQELIKAPRYVNPSRKGSGIVSEILIKNY